MNLSLKLCFAACAALFGSNAGASGNGGFDYDRFFSRGAPDFSLARYQAGQLGVVQPGYQRVYLYTAWRAIMLGEADLKAAPNPAGGIARANGSAYSGWDDFDKSAQIYLAWRGAVDGALKRATAASAEFRAVEQGMIECPRESYTFATRTLEALAKRSDATPARLQAWVEAQQQVFKFCGDDPALRYRQYGAARPVLPVPPELPASESAYWSQLRGYQMAAAYFYNGELAESARRFSLIGATAGHPMRQWGAYLALRSDMREAARTVKPGGPDQAERALELEAAAQRILDDASLAALHEPTRASVRAMRAKLTPAARFEQLSGLLDDPRANPYLDDHLGDWRILAESELDLFRPKRGERHGQRHDFIDWIVTLQSCGFPSRTRCKQQGEHAKSRWEQALIAGKPAARAWLVAAVSLADTLPAPMEQAALKVAPGSPEYATVRYHLARTYRLAGQAAKARAIDDAMLAAPTDSVSIRNLFLQERFAVATSNAEAAPYLLRKIIRNTDVDTGETVAAEGPAVPAADGQRWLNSQLAVADLLELAQNGALDGALRNALAGAAWLRADLLGQQDAALRAAALLAPVSPELAAAARRYQAEKTAAGRRHSLILSALRLRLTPLIEPYEAYRSQTFVAAPPDEALASNWCNVTYSYRSTDPDQDPIQPAPPPATSIDPAQRTREIEALYALPTATGLIGQHVMQRAKTVPNDPDLPWLLYVVVQSTRGGCVDPDSRSLSKNAFTLLHRRFPASEWARKTPYFY